MDYDNYLLGAGTRRVLLERVEEIIFSIGTDGFTRGHLARVDCFNFTSAKNPHLLAVLDAPDLIGEPGNTRKPRNTKDFFFNVPPKKLARPGIGAFTLAILGAAFEAKKIGGDEPLKAWVEHHKMEVVTFNTLKNREERERDPERLALIAKQRDKLAAKAKRAQDKKERRDAAILAKAARTLHTTPRKRAAK